MKIIDYWPPKIQDINEFKEIACAEQTEIDLIKENVKQLPNEFVVSTATNEGLTRYESMLGLYKAETVELRKSNILANLNNSLPLSLIWLRNLLNSVVGKDNFLIYLKNYDLEISLVETKEYLLNMLKEDLRKKIPANIEFSVKVLESVDCNCYTGFYIQTADVITV